MQHLNCKLRNVIAEITRIFFDGPSKAWDLKSNVFNLLLKY